MFRLILAAALIILLPGLAWAERVALVIGMSNYQSVAPLKNTLNDAQRIADKLQEVGFQVTLATDKTQTELLDIMDAFSFQAETADLALIYYAGHGVEVQGVNYLVPIDATVTKADDMVRVGISLNQVLKTVENARQMRVVILDSCRNNPFVGIEGFGTSGDTSLSGNTAAPGAVTQGLAPVNPKLGTLVAYAAKAGQVALDGLGDNSPYATALIDAFGRPNVEIGMMFRQIRDDVLKATGNLQEPFQYGSLPGTDFYLAGDGAGATQVASADSAPLEVDWSRVSTEQKTRMIQAANEGDARASFKLGYGSLTQGDPNIDFKQGLEYLRQAADAGYADAQYQMAKYYEQGFFDGNQEILAPDPVKALALYQAAADQGLAVAVNDMGFFSYDGRLGLARDEAKAIEYFARAAELRHPEAMFNYASLIDEGMVDGKGPEEAAHYLYDSLRVGSEAVLNQLATKPENFKLPTRKELQKELKKYKFYDGPIDGDFGGSTQKALRKAFGLSE